MTSAEEAARRYLAGLKDEMDDLGREETNEAGDAHFEILHDILDWALKTAGHLEDRHGGYVVVLRRGLRDEDTVMLMRFLLNINGVIAVNPIPEDAKMHIAERRALYRMKDAIDGAIAGE